MTEDEFQEFVAPCGDDQRAGQTGLRDLVLRHSTGLDEAVNTGRWLTGFVFYSTSGQMVYAFGPKGRTKISFHMMPYYGSAVLQQRHGRTLDPFLTGKSCIAFRRLDDVPVDALIDIVERGTPIMQQMVADHLGTRARVTGARPRPKRT